MLVLRLLPYLTQPLFSAQLKELWSKILLSLPLVGKRDTLGDNILPKFYPYFKNHIESYSFTDISDLSSNLTEIIKQDNVRSTPIAIRGKPRLHFILSNKVGRVNKSETRANRLFVSVRRVRHGDFTAKNGETPQDEPTAPARRTEQVGGFSDEHGGCSQCAQGCRDTGR